jgi:DNA-binding CsgD family transcriptional regulator
MKINQDNIISELTKNFVHADENIDAYEDFLSSWQCFADQKKSEEDVLQEEYQSIEKFAVSRISRLVEKNEASTGYKSSSLFNSLHNSAMICNIDGIVFDVNNQAQKTYHLSKGMMLDNLNLRLESGLNISSIVRKLLMGSSPESNLSLLQFYPSSGKTDEMAIPVIIMRLHDKNDSLPQALIIFMGEACNEETLKLFASKFSLTKAETDVIAAFSKGMVLKEIAKSRYRSYTTIRNQFQSILEKTGCSNQADLLRMLLGISYLLSYTEMMSTNQTVELGKKIEVMRPHGRFVDIRLYGDLKGKPFIAVHSLFGMPITKEIEKKLISRSLLMIGIFRPGFSFTSPPHNNETNFQCLADDISAVLDNIINF